MQRQFLRLIYVILGGLTNQSCTSANGDNVAEISRPLEIHGVLKPTDPTDRGLMGHESYCQSYPVALRAGRIYQIDLMSKEFDVLLRLEDPEGNKLRQRYTAMPNARLVYRPEKDGVFRIIVTSGQSRKIGQYTLRAREVDRGALLEEEIKTLAFQRFLEQNRILRELKQYLREKGQALTAADLGIAVKAVKSLERSDPRQAATASRELAHLATAATDSKAREQARFLAGLARRLSLIGQEFFLEGTTLDGKPFNLGSYRGKAIVVQFATVNHSQFLSQWKFLQQIHESFHAKGLEVVTVSLDESPKTLADFLSRVPSSWACLHGPRGPLAELHRNSGEPIILLVGQTGRVISLSSSRMELVMQVSNLLGPSTRQGGEQASAWPPEMMGPRANSSRPDRFPTSKGQGLPASEKREPSFEEFVTPFVVQSIFILPFISILANQARRRGYSWFFWLFAGVISLNPVLPLILLGLLPNRANQAKRRKELELLDQRLAQSRISSTPARNSALASIDIASGSAPPSTSSLAGSLGDQSTI